MNELEAAPTKQEARPRRPWLDVGALITIAALLLLDLAGDAATASALHVALELTATVFALVVAARQWARWVGVQRELEHRVAALDLRLHAVSADAERWRREAWAALQGLGAAIEAQCDRWTLTEAERAVALLLLKGLSMKEVADVRGTTERTARQQALGVYRKAGLAGRAELSAFFLEDLLLPSSRPSAI